MDITGFQIYLITRLDGLKLGITIAGAAVFILSLMLIGLSINDRENKIESGLMKGGICGLVVSVLLAIGNIMTPTTKEAAAIVVLPRVVNSSEVKKTCGELYTLAMGWIEYLKPPKPQEYK